MFFKTYCNVYTGVPVSVQCEGDVSVFLSLLKVIVQLFALLEKNTEMVTMQNL